VSDEAVRFFQALGDGTRLDLLLRLRERERTVGELVELLRCPQPKVSRHLKVLKDVGLVTDRREGRHVTYALTTRRRWGAGVREWLDQLAGGFPPPVPGQEPARRRAAAPAGEDRPEPATTPVRRPRLETHLL